MQAIAGQVNSTPPTANNHDIIPVRVDPQGQIITAGAGTAGTPSGGVQTVQGVAGGTPLPVSTGPDYEAVAASANAQILGPTGAVGDRLDGVLIVPATLSPGAVSITDGNGVAITIFAGGTNSIGTLHPFFVPIGAKCVAASTPGWKVTTGANVSAVGVGDFT